MIDGDLPDLIAALKAISLKTLSRDPNTGDRYAIGFDADGWPYRAFRIETKEEQDASSTVKYEVAS